MGCAEYKVENTKENTSASAHKNTARGRQTSAPYFHEKQHVEIALGLRNSFKP